MPVNSNLLASVTIVIISMFLLALQKTLEIYGQSAKSGMLPLKI